MANKKNRTNISDERIEDSTMYGEFIPSFDQWITPDRQRKIARHLEEVTEELAPGDDEKRSN
ncbi:MAG: hypothetical protein A2Y21_03490 [Clostridiales bacterium GWC2_40_7]|nr:MAG: hypothetical protein A2Y21_03490 [Clostridiales bacterium GWC2_40_7]